MTGGTPAAPAWLAGLLAGERTALARAITAVENETPEAVPVLAAIYPRLGHALVVGVTGQPGAGKSTLVNAYIALLRRGGKSVGVVAVDPSSPFSGGALLGDRIRMIEHAGDPAVFVRSVAARGHLGGLSRTCARVVDVLDAGGKEVVIVETVGVGQSEIAIADLADVRIVVCAPGAGDEVQAAKAGVLEIADLVVVNKADLPGAERTRHALAAAAALIPAERRPRVMTTVATGGEGVALLAGAIDDKASADATRLRLVGPSARARRLIAAEAGELLRARLLALADERLDRLCDRVLKGELDLAGAATRAWALITDDGRVAGQDDDA